MTLPSISSIEQDIKSRVGFYKFDPETLAMERFNLQFSDSEDYAGGYAAGRLGIPDPHNAPYSFWRGWRDGAAEAGHLPRSRPFG